MLISTPEQEEQCTLVQQEFVELANRLLAEGIALPVMLGGLSNAVTAIVAHSGGAKAVCIWFAQNAALTMHLTDGD